MSAGTFVRRTVPAALAVISLVFIVGCPFFPAPIPGDNNNNNNNNGDNNTNNNTGDGNTNNTTNTPTTPTPDPAKAATNNVPGTAAFKADSGLPGMVITIVSVTTADTEFVPQFGKSVAVNFKLATRDGKAIAASDLNRFSTFISGPITHYQRVLAAEGTISKIVDKGGGLYSYTFSKALPDKFIAPVNDSTAFGASDGEKTGQALTPGTYSVAIEARRSVTRGDETFNDAGDAVLNFLIGDGPLTQKQVVIAQNCMACHGQVSLHGGNRLSVTGCVLCHTAGAEDRINTNPAKATPGVSVEFANMIHGIHRGSDLPKVKATAKGSDPYKYEIVGFGDNVLDFSHTVFPYMPGGTGFNLQTKNCAACHGGAADENMAYARPSRTACSGCHDDLNFVDGTRLNDANSNVIAGTLTKAQLSDSSFRELVGGFRHSFTDDQCTLCHAEGSALDVKASHDVVLRNPTLTNGIKVVITSVSGQSGGNSFFSVGDFPVVVFNILDRNNNPIDISTVSSLNFVLSGPTGMYQKVLPTSSSSTLAMKGNGGVPSSGTGPFTYTSTVAIPATFPAPFNNSTAFQFGDGSGELFGLPLVSGTYTIGIWAYRQFTHTDGLSYRETSDSVFANVQLLSAGATEPYADFITDAKCNACHGDLRFHGNGRKGVRGCVLCHGAGAEDRPVAMGQTEDPAPDSIDFKVMIHKIHNAVELEVVKNGGAYDLGGFSGIADFSRGELPYLQGFAKNCTACHANDAWKTPVERDDQRVWMLACTSCHDGNSTKVHIDLNTSPATMTSPGIESCATCHGDGRAFAVEELHRLP